MNASLRRLLTLLIAVSLVMAPLGGALAMAGITGEHPVSVHCAESGAAPANGLHTGHVDTDHSHADTACCDLPCLMKCGHGVIALPAPAVAFPLTATDTVLTSAAALADVYFPPPGHPPKAR